MNSLPPKRILMTADTIGGVWTYALDLISALEMHGVEVVLATMGAPLSSDQRRNSARLDNLEIRESAFKLEWMEDPWGDVQKAGNWLLDLEQETAPDLIHLNGYAHGSLPWRAPKIIVGHSCVLSWWTAVKGCVAPPDWTRYASAVRKGLRAADGVVAPTHAMLDCLNEHYGPISGARVIPNGRVMKKFSPGQKKRIVLCAGRLWDEAKNVRAACAIAPESPWPVYIAGEKTHPDGRSDCYKGVHWLGHLSENELALWMSQAAVYLLPAKYEPFGLSVLEAALSGCALVLGDIPSLRENWEGAALFVDPSDPRAIGRTVQLLAESEELRNRLGAKARERGLGLGIDTTTLKYLECYSAMTKKEEQEQCALA